MSINYIFYIRKCIFKFYVQKYVFLSPYYFDWICKPNLYSSRCTKTNEVSKNKSSIISYSWKFKENIKMLSNIRISDIAAMKQHICKSMFKKLVFENKHRYFILLSIAGGSVNDPNESNWETEKKIAQKIREAKIAFKEGNVLKAKSILEDTISVHGNSITMQVGMTCVYEMLATIAYQSGELERAQALLMTVIDKLLHSGIKTHDNSITSFTLKIARLYDEQKKDNLAELGYKNCITLQRVKYTNGQMDDDTGLMWINALYWYGKFLESRKRFMEAKQCFDSSYTLCGQVKAIKPAQIMVILYDLAEMATMTGDFDIAQRHYLNAIILGRDINSKDLPIYYVKLGLINLYKGLNEQAYIWCDFGRVEAKRKRDKGMENEAIKCLQQLKTD